VLTDTLPDIVRTALSIYLYDIIAIKVTYFTISNTVSQKHCIWILNPVSTNRSTFLPEKIGDDKILKIIINHILL